MPVSSTTPSVAPLTVKDEEGGFPVGATLVAMWMGQTERTCVIIDRSKLRQIIIICREGYQTTITP
jgi:hypothetical protein